MPRFGARGRSTTSSPDAAVAGRFLDFWEELRDQAEGTPELRTWIEAANPVDLTAQPVADLSLVFSPRSTQSTLLDWYAGIFDSGVSSAHITGAFGIHKVFRDKLELDRAVVRTVLLDREPTIGQEIPSSDRDVRVSWGDYLHHSIFDQWAQENLTNFNTYVKFIHTKIILVDPLTDDPVVITGSANYSDNSTTDNEENSVLLVGSGDDATKRVADIYLTEYHRLFMYFVFRDFAERDVTSDAAGPGTARLVENDTWTEPYYEVGGWKARQRQTFAGTL